MEVNINQSDPIFDDKTRQDLPESITEQAPVKKPDGKFNMKVLAIGVIGLLIALVTSYFVFFRNNAPAEPESSNVTVTISGPKELASGNQAEYIINYQNGENADLVELSMEVFYPSNFKFKSAEPSSKISSGQAFDLPVLRQGQQGELIIRGELTGFVGEQKDLRVKLNYKLSNFNSAFSVEQSYSTKILSPNLSMQITGPVDVTNGQDTTFSVSYSNVSSQTFENVSLNVIYPEGFKYVASNPPATKDNKIWNLGTLAPGTNGKIDISGSFTGDSGQEKIVVGELGFSINNTFAPQITSSVAFKITPSSISLVQNVTPADYTTLGKSIRYVLEYGNYGTVGMTDVVISVTFDSAAVDISKIKSNEAIITGNTLTWKSATLKNLALLAPNQEGTISFDVPIKSTLSTNIKNVVVKSTAQIYSDQVKSPIKAKDVEIKIASSLSSLISAKYVSGAMPMKVGQPTTYSITMLITNTSNDLSEVELTASLQLPDTAWKNVVFPESERNNFVFDVNANKIRWKAGNVAAFVGKFTPARSVTFDLEVIPNNTDSGKEIEFLTDIKATGRDTFVNQVIESTRLSSFKTGDMDGLESSRVEP